MVTDTEAAFHFVVWLAMEKFAMPESAACIEEIRRLHPDEANAVRLEAAVALWLEINAAISAEWERRLRRGARGAAMTGDDYGWAVGRAMESVFDGGAMAVEDKTRLLRECARRHVDAAMENITVTLDTAERRDDAR